MIKDKNISWNVKREFISVHQMTGRDADMATVLGAGAAVFQEIGSTSQLAGLAIGAAGDEIFHSWKIPWDLDRDLPIQARLLFVHETTDADTPDWLVSMKGRAEAEAINVATSGPDATFTFPAKAVTETGYSLEATAWKSSGSDSGLSATDLLAMIAIECNGLGDAGADEITLLGIELAYTIKATTDTPHRDTTAVALSDLY